MIKKLELILRVCFDVDIDIDDDAAADVETLKAGWSSWSEASCSSWPEILCCGEEGFCTENIALMTSAPWRQLDTILKVHSVQGYEKASRGLLEGYQRWPAEGHEGSWTWSLKAYIHIYLHPPLYKTNISLHTIEYNPKTCASTRLTF